MGDNDSHRRGSVLIELESWNEAITACDDKNYEECLQKFLDVPDPSAKIMFNIGNVQIVLGEHAQAIQVSDVCGTVMLNDSYRCGS